MDDEPELATVAQKMLEYLGYEAYSRTSSIEALKFFRLHLLDNPFDLVLTDLTMPHLTGLDLARNLLSLQPDLPIVLCTGFKDKITEEQAKHLGLQRLLQKPVSIQALAVTIRQVLDEKTVCMISINHRESNHHSRHI